MRIRALERGLLGRERIERMMDAKSDDEAVRVLADCGYEEISPVSAQTLERALANEREKTYAMAAQMLPASFIDVFRVRYDYHNVKTLIKAEAMNENADGLIVEAGRVPKHKLLDIYRNLAFSSLPKMMVDSVIDARDVLARTNDPQRSDFLLDTACVKEMLLSAEESGSDFLMGYVRLYIDLLNLRSVVRADRIQKGPDFLRLILCDGGNISVSRISSGVTGGAALEDAFTGNLSDTAAVGTTVMRGDSPLTAFEKRCDDLLTQYLQKCRYVPFGEQPIISYLAAREAEMNTIRTIITGRLAGVSMESIRERLREAYV